jgi:anti-sigma regulatory factor (Ser/Thr protein kinase)
VDLARAVRRRDAGEEHASSPENQPEQTVRGNRPTTGEPRNRTTPAVKPGSGSELLRLAVSCDPDAPRHVRRALDRLDGIAPIRDDAKLVATELVSNAVLHSGGTAADIIEVRVRLRARALEIAVTDPGRSRDRPALRARGRLARSGRGLILVDGIAERWGTSDGDGRLVWAWIPL